MAKYIEIDKIENFIRENFSIDKVGTADVCYAFIDFVFWLEEQPTADVVEVKHGYWVRQEKMADGKVRAEAVCSSCGTDVVYQAIDNRWQFENYCPHCGARMDGDTQ